MYYSKEKINVRDSGRAAFFHIFFCPFHKTIYLKLESINLTSFRLSDHILNEMWLERLSNWTGLKKYLTSYLFSNYGGQKVYV